MVEGEGDVSRIPILEVWNKVDMVDADRAAELREMAETQGDAMVISALSGDGVDELLERIGIMLTSEARVIELELAASDGKRLAWLHAHGEVLSDEPAGEGAEGPIRHVSVRLNPKELGQFEQL